MRFDICPPGLVGFCCSKFWAELTHQKAVVLCRIFVQKFGKHFLPLWGLCVICRVRKFLGCFRTDLKNQAFGPSVSSSDSTTLRFGNPKGNSKSMSSWIRGLARWTPECNKTISYKHR